MHDWKKFRISSEPSEGPKPAIKLPPDHVIGSTAQMQRLARLLIYIDVPRRQVKDWITNTMHGFEGYVVDGRRPAKGCIKKWIHGSANKQPELSAAEEATVKKRRFPRFHHKKTTSCHKTTLGKAAVHDRMKKIP